MSRRFYNIRMECSNFSVAWELLNVAIYAKITGIPAKTINISNGLVVYAYIKQ